MDISSKSEKGKPLWKYFKGLTCILLKTIRLQISLWRADEHPSQHNLAQVLYWGPKERVVGLIRHHHFEPLAVAASLCVCSSSRQKILSQSSTTWNFRGIFEIFRSQEWIVFTFGYGILNHSKVSPLKLTAWIWASSSFPSMLVIRGHRPRYPGQSSRCMWCRAWAIA